jgi:hypothetical protein
MVILLEEDDYHIRMHFVERTINKWKTGLTQ